MLNAVSDRCRHETAYLIPLKSLGPLMSVGLCMIQYFDGLVSESSMLLQTGLLGTDHAVLKS